MKWRSVVFVMIWVVVVFLLMFPSSCKAWTICETSSVSLVILLGVVAALLAISDASQVRREARERLLGIKKREIDESDGKS